MKKLISLILTFTLSFSMFSCTGTFATTETRDGVVQVYNNGNNGKENLKSKKTNTLNILKKFLMTAAAVGSAAFMSFIVLKKNIFKFFNQGEENSIDQTASPNNSNWVLQCLPATLETLLIVATVLLPLFIHN